MDEILFNPYNDCCGELIRIMDFHCGSTYLARYGKQYAGGRVSDLSESDQALILTYIVKNRINHPGTKVIEIEHVSL